MRYLSDNQIYLIYYREQTRYTIIMDKELRNAEN